MTGIIWVLFLLLTMRSTTNRIVMVVLAVGLLVSLALPGADDAEPGQVVQEATQPDNAEIAVLPTLTAPFPGGLGSPVAEPNPGGELGVDAMGMFPPPGQAESFSSEPQAMPPFMGGNSMGGFGGGGGSEAGSGGDTPSQPVAPMATSPQTSPEIAASVPREAAVSPNLFSALLQLVVDAFRQYNRLW
ncbi:MAG: hypothetical protein HC915_17110 [Anaerolineae bacterium]|nr:hypothetical protein [Anaerolineae bacterium]